MAIYCELNESVTRIEVSFPYDPVDVARIKGHRPDEYGPGVKGRRWDPERRVWHVPMDLQTARRLRDVFGERMKLGPAFRAWAKEQVNLERNLRSLHGATDAKLKHTPGIIMDVIAGKAMDFKLPKKHALRHERPARPYQRADIRMMSLAPAINANDVGTGKTLEVCGSVYEAQLNPRPILIVAPRRTLHSVWQAEFERLTDYEVLTSEDPKARKVFMEEAVTGIVSPPWALALIADDLRLVKYRNVKDPAPEEEHPLHACRDYKGNWYKFRSDLQRELFEIHFGAFVVDEFHQTGLPNRTSLFHISAQQIKADYRWPMSGTPIGGKPRRLWPILNFIDPKQYSSEWRWIEEYLVIDEEEIYVRGGVKRKVKTVGGIKDEDKFYEDHKKHMVRRTKRDALPGLPDAIEILVETPMTPTQRKQYDEFDRAHEIVVGQKRLSGSIVLSQYLRLRQMANSSLKPGPGGKWLNTADGGKLEHLLERLDENGIRKHDPEPGARAYVGVLDKSYCGVVIEFLRDHGIDCGRLDGDTKDSQPILDHFHDQEGRRAPYVIVMTIQTGGSGLDLGVANSAHALDEDWDPDRMYQFFGRGDRGSRTKALLCYTYRTLRSIQEYVSEVAAGKKVTNSNVLNYVSEIEKLRKGSG